MAAAKPNNQSLIQGDDDPEEPPPEEPQYPEEPYPEEPQYPEEPYPGEPQYPEEPYPEEPQYPEEPYPGEPLPGEPGTETPGNDGDPNNDGTDTPTTGTTRTVAGVTRPTGMLVPLYIHPSTGVWERLIAQKRKHPSVDVVASVNPNNGPGAEREAAYTNGIKLLVDAGIRVIGYVSTLHLRRNVAEIQRDIRAWKEFYPQVQGIFFDDHDNETGTEARYLELANYAKVDNGFQLTVGNPGTMYTAKGFFDAMDIMLVHETSVPLKPEEMTRELTMKGIPRTKCAVTPYDVSQLDPQHVQDLTRWIQFIYFTDDFYRDTQRDNPWDTLPSYLEPLFELLDPPT